MTGDTLAAAVQRLQALAGAAALEGVADGQVLERFAQRGEEAAFAALVRRHGPMVLGVCRRVLRREQDAEDAFQATFLVLARSAAAIAKRDSVASWLYGVAYRVALRARTNEARRQAAAVPAVPADVADPLAEASRRELRGILDEELGRLPARFRRPLVLCYLEGRSHPEAARELGCPVGTVRSRLARGREILRGRLARRGLAGAGAALAAPALAAPLPDRLLVAAVRGGLDWAAGRPAGSPAAAALAEGAVRALAGHRAVTLAAAVVLLTLLATAGLAVLPRGPAPLPPGGPRQPEGAAVDVVPKDFNGDPLPPHAVARLGTTRFRHGGHVNYVALSPDGALAASAGQDNLVRVWDTATGKERFRHRSGGGVAFSPDGKLLAAGGIPDAGGNRVFLLDAATGREVAALPVSASKGFPVVFAPAGGTLAVKEGATVSFWDVATGKERFRCPYADFGDGIGLAFSPDGRTVAVSSPGGTALWDTATWQRAGSLKVPAAALAFSPDGKTLVAAWAGLPSGLTFHDPATGRELRRLAVEPTTSAAFTPDGKGLLLGGPEYVRLLDVASGTELWRIPGPTAVALAADGRTAVTSSQLSPVVRLWDPATGRERRPVAGHGKAVAALAFAPDGKTLASAGADEPGVLFWQTATGKPLPGPRPTPHERTGYPALAFAPDGRLLAGAESGRIRLWDTASGDAVQEIVPLPQVPTCAAFSPDGKRLVVGGSPAAQVIEIATARARLLPADRLPATPALAAAFTPDGQAVAASGQGWAALWDAGTAAVLRQVTAKDRPLVFAPDGRTLAEVGYDAARVLAAETGAATAELRGAGQFRCAAFSPDGKRLATGHDDGVVRVWDAATGKELDRLPGHDGPVRVVAFSPDGRTLASGGSDTTVLLWDVGRP
jgi:RNA polymerase sigma factor (sigma-70 family)